MHALELDFDGTPRLVEAGEHEPPPGSVAVDVDLVFVGPLDLAPGTPPGPVGRGITGRVRTAVPELGLAAGARVIVDPTPACGRCVACRAGRPQRCAAPLPAAAGAVEVLAWPATKLLPLPEGLDAEGAALAHPVALALAALRRLAPAPGEGCTVVGLGPVGLTVLQLARACGLQPLFAADPVGERGELALAFGADLAAVDPEIVREAAGGGTDVVVASPEAGPAALRAATLAAAGGRCALIQPAAEALLPLPAQEVTLARITAPTCADLLDAARLVAGGRVDPTPLVSHRTSPEAAPGFLRRLREEPPSALGVLVHLR